ncbi:uncharacterized protein KGF55_002457 [Candida pseudojiufengensis]|uniref:uncharacterized protein n=1 Tax=Candida pseudojiufengensis TaxID=497109 RepID=UPI002223F5C2|nr:uncharacterized protein KGF55_002457 [Candida pseudojiufengensis]KAI5963577.1 hypothetical protein KGF55_002457 [Candida pseudojiufengensis]
MAFAFGFTNEELSDDDAESSSTRFNSSTPASKSINYKLDTYKVEEEHLPKVHTLESILKSLEGVRITFDYHKTTNDNIIYRRDLFDVKHQIMMEDCDDKLDSKVVIKDEIKNIVIEKNDSDVQRNIYEGGFKSWECSYDTIDEIGKLMNQYSGSTGFSLNILNSSTLDLGCGTSLPSCYILMKKFETKCEKSMKLILSDFNYDVLRLVTVPNLIINWASTLPSEDLQRLTTDEINSRFEANELFITTNLINEFLKQLKDSNTEIKLISGSWGKEFNDLVSKYHINFIISSETIYSTVTLPIVAESIKIILSDSATFFKNNGKTFMCLLAAKNIYFGVGGSIVEFLSHFKSISDSKFKVEVKEIHDSQLKRSLVLIEYCP